ncbi:MAG TPA: hypothetical protein VK404_07285 [Spirosoma sp.]|nr:hypothetical protein [Spirosoma sp.]
MATKIMAINAKFIIRLWDVKGYPNYFIVNVKQLYRYGRRGQLKKQTRRYQPNSWLHPET